MITIFWKSSYGWSSLELYLKNPKRNIGIKMVSFFDTWYMGIYSYYIQNSVCKLFPIPTHKYERLDIVHWGLVKCHYMNQSYFFVNLVGKHCIFWIFMGWNLVSHYLKRELHPNYALRAIIKIHVLEVQML
jgi:hypothetical protein